MSLGCLPCWHRSHKFLLNFSARVFQTLSGESAVDVDDKVEATGSNVVSITPHSDESMFFSVPRQRSLKPFLNCWRTSTSSHKFLTRLLKSTTRVVEHETDTLKREDVLIVERALTTEPEGVASDYVELGLLTRALEIYYRFLHVPFQELFDTLEMNATSF